MTNQEMANQTKLALEDRFKQSGEEQIKRLIAHGTINEKGEVLMGREISCASEQQ